MKYILMILMVVLLAGCSPSSKTITYDAMPPELADCKTYYISNGLNGITVMRCH